MFPLVDATTLYVSLKPNFFCKPWQIDCDVDKFSCCGGAENIPEVHQVMSSRLKVDKNLRTTQPIKVNFIRTKGKCVRVTISHFGILALHNIDDFKLELVSIHDRDKRAEITTEHATLLGFYDHETVVLTAQQPLRTGFVDDLFLCNSFKCLDIVEGQHSVEAIADVSYLNTRRELFFLNTRKEAFIYNVDTRVVTRMFEDDTTSFFPTLMGIASEIKLVRKSDGGDQNTIFWDGREGSFRSRGTHLSALLLSSSKPGVISEALQLSTDGGFIFKSSISSQFPWDITCAGVYGIVRVYQDVFLVYDKKTESWYMMRIIIK